MAFFDWFRRPAMVMVQDGDARFEVEGSQRFVERALRLFLERRKHVTITQTRLPAPVPAPQPAEEPTVKTLIPAQGAPAVVSSGSKTWQHKRHFVRLHAIDGDIAKVYSVESKKLDRTWLAKAFNMNRVKNIYAEDANLLKHVRNENATLWHRLMPKGPESALN